MTERFDRSGDEGLKKRALTALANHLGLASFSDMHRGLESLLEEARSGKLTDDQVEGLEGAVDLIQRVEALDRPWVFGQRYMRHKFVSSDPICPNCNNEVPHRTILLCPTCEAPGPWEMREHTVMSSYVHYFLVEQVTRLINNQLLLHGGEHFADGMVTAMPRGGAKSTWLCEIVGTFLILTGRSRCLLVLSNTVDQVTERCNEIKTELEENPLIVEDFGEQRAGRQSTRTWTKSEFILPNGGRVIGKGAMQAMRGVKNREYRPDAVISDDSDDEKFLTTPDMASKVWDWWDTRVVPACHPNAIYMFHGTVIGEMALLWQTMHGRQGATFAKKIFKAIQDRPGCVRCGMPAPNVGKFDCPICQIRTDAIQPVSYWGSRFTVEALNTIRNRIGHWAWQAEFDQSPHDDSTSWFNKDWIDNAYHEDLAPLNQSARRIIPWSAISCTLTGEEAVNIATMADQQYRQVPGDYGPYQVIVQCWDPAWARKKGKEQMTAWMAGLGMGLTWDDKYDIFWLDRDRALPGNAAYREWMYRTWVNDIMPMGKVERPGQVGMIIERNSAGVLFQYGVEEHWGSVPVLDHQTGAEKHDLTDGIPGLASAFKNGEVIIRAGGSARQRELADELVYELKHSGRSQFTDMLMTAWFGWSYINRWKRDVRDPARYAELARRSTNSGVPRHKTH